MPQDYKDMSNPRESHPPSSFRQALSYFTIGLTVGLLAAIAIYLRKYPHGAPPPSQATPVVQAPVVEKKSPPPEAPAKRNKTELKFDFYTILPEMEVQISGWKPEDPLPPKLDLPPEPQGRYVLQAGSFRYLHEARQLTAHLERLRLPTDVQTVDLNEQGRWYRVRVGPFASIERLNQAGKKLREHGIHFILLKGKESQEDP